MNRRALLAGSLLALCLLVWFVFYFSQPTEDGTPRSLKRSWRALQRAVSGAASTARGER